MRARGGGPRCDRVTWTEPTMPDATRCVWAVADEPAGRTRVRHGCGCGHGCGCRCGHRCGAGAPVSLRGGTADCISAPQAQCRHRAHPRTQSGPRPDKVPDTYPGPAVRPGHSDSETAEDARIERARAEPDHGLASRCLTTRPILRVGGPRETIRALEAAAPGNPPLGARTRRRGNYSGTRRGLPRRELDVLRLKDSIAGLLSQNVTPTRSGDLDINHCAREPSCPPPNIPRSDRRLPGTVTVGATCDAVPC